MSQHSCGDDLHHRVFGGADRGLGRTPQAQDIEFAEENCISDVGDLNVDVFDSILELNKTRNPDFPSLADGYS